jgi:hypothetical protein
VVDAATLPGVLEEHGGYILAAYWFTSSTSFANPAVTIARRFSNTFAGVALSNVAMFVFMQLLGGLVGYALIRGLYPHAAVLAAEVTSNRTELPAPEPAPTGEARQ